MNRLHEHLRRRARADRELAVLSTQLDAVGCRISILDADDLPRLEIVALDESQELAVLIAHASHRDVFAERTGQQRLVLRPAERPLGSGNRIAVRVGRRPAEHLVDEFNEPVGDGVLEVLGLVVNFGPAHPHHLHQEELNQSVPAEDARGELLAGSVSRTPA